MTWAWVAVGVSTALTAYSANQQSRAQKDMANYNAKVAEIQAQDAITRGNEEASKVRRQYAQMAGRQRAELAAKGLDLTEGTTADVIDQTDFFSQIDQNTARDNAAREAWNLRARRQGYQYEASTQRPGQAAFLAGAGTVASRWYSYGNTSNRT